VRLRKACIIANANAASLFLLALTWRSLIPCKTILYTIYVHQIPISFLQISPFRYAIKH